MKVNIGDEFYVREDEYTSRKGPRCRLVTVKSQTSRSWIVGRDGSSFWDKKIPKHNLSGLFTKEQTEQYDWVQNNEWRIKECIRNLGYEKLKQIAVIVGYKEKHE